MDDLDRLAFRVSRTVRTTHPHLLERGFTLADLEERLAPYPMARRELAAGGPDGYELTVLRLLSGERGYLAAQPSLQDACRQALQMPSPAISLVRMWANSPLLLQPHAFALATERDTAFPSAGSARLDPDQLFGLPPEPAAIVSAPSTPTALAGTIPIAAPTADITPTAISTCDCHYCGGTLPDGRTLKFCPYCGLDLTIRHCPACSTELERNWRYCVTCGRQAEEHAPLASHTELHAEPGPAARLAS